MNPSDPFAHRSLVLVLPGYCAGGSISQLVRQLVATGVRVTEPEGDAWGAGLHRRESVRFRDYAAERQVVIWRTSTLLQRSLAHAGATIGGYRWGLCVRDPRDVTVSCYLGIAGAHPLPINPEALHEILFARRAFQSLGFEDGCRFVAATDYSRIRAAYDFGRDMLALLEPSGRAFLSYLELVQEPIEFSRKLWRLLGPLAVPDETTAIAVGKALIEPTPGVSSASKTTNEDQPPSADSPSEQNSVGGAVHPQYGRFRTLLSPALASELTTLFQSELNFLRQVDPACADLK